jgi:hypothetical protein
MINNNIFYFNPCKNCGGLEPFGIPNNSSPFTPWPNFSSDTIGTQYSLVIGSYSGCVEYSGSTSISLPNINIINGSPIFSASTCDNCIKTYPCYTQPNVTPPTVVGYKNECGIITILPMGVKCITSASTTSDSYDGEVSLIITGGTPPYKTTWLNNGVESPALNGLGNDYYTATTVDYWGDFSATTVCELYTPPDCTFNIKISEYTLISNTKKYYTITLSAGTTSPGPYTIHLNQSGGTIPLLYPDLTPAQNIDRDTLLSGVIIQTDSVPASIVVVNEYCQTIITLPPPTNITYKNFCLSFNSTALPNTVYKHFIPNGIVGGFPSWISDTTPVPNPPITITWNSNNSNWVINNYNPLNSTILSISPANVNSNPPSNWISVGGSATVNVELLPREVCPTLNTSQFSRSVNHPTCKCDGSIIFNVNLDNPPFSYSIDNGVTYSSSPIFTNLCSGIYTLAVLDSLGNVYTSSETIKTSQPSTTYTISLVTTKTTPVSNTISSVNSYETNVVITPPLPDGAVVTFDLIHTNSFYSSPTSGTSILKTGTILTKNTTDIIIDSTVTSNTTAVNTTPGCQNNLLYQSNINDVWNSLTISNTDTITINTTSRVDKTTTGKCVVGYSNDTYSISNPVISGCDCCSIKIN